MTLDCRVACRRDRRFSSSRALLASSKRGDVEVFSPGEFALSSCSSLGRSLCLRSSLGVPRTECSASESPTPRPFAGEGSHT
jgi:hypothetical protein